MSSFILKCKQDFPIFESQKDVIYFDTASTSQKPKVVIDSINDFYYSCNANVHRGLYPWAEKSTFLYESARSEVADFINTKSKNLIFTKGTTESINFISNSFVNKDINSSNNIVITEMEHHSNIIPWQILSKITGAELRYIPISYDGELVLDDIHKYIDDKTKIVSLIHQSNVFGTINPIDEIIDFAHKKGSLVMLDAAQSIAHQRIDVKNLDCDFLVFSGHKILGPTGIGCLYAKKNILENLSPYQTGGQMISEVNKDSSTWNEIPFRFEAGTPNISGAIGLKHAIQYIKKLGIENIELHNKYITKYCLDKLIQEIDGINIYGHKKDSGPIISFNIRGVHSYDLSSLLAQQNIYIRSGHHCAQPIMKKLNIESSNRISLYIYNDKKDIDFLIKAIKKAVNILKN
tara:strand:+ start:1721 stop:2935 length:1215 start_codon:yes stop_codon:yes gene_type:complete